MGPTASLSPRRPARSKPVNSIPSDKVQDAAAAFDAGKCTHEEPVQPRSASDWTNIVHSLSHPQKRPPTPHNSQQLSCLAEALQTFPEAEVEAITATPDSLTAFLSLAGAAEAPKDADLYLHIGAAFLRPQLQEAVATDDGLSTAADAIVASATHTCEDSFWHPAVVAAAAQLQLVLCRGHRAFWHLLARNTDSLHECDARSFAQIAECAAALRIRQPALWAHLAASTNTLALHMPTSDLHACVRALGATIPDNTPPRDPAAHLPPDPVASADLESMLEVVQWRGGQGVFDAADLPYTALSVSAVLFRTLPGATEGGGLSAATRGTSQAVPGFWQALVQQSRRVCSEAYGSRDALNMALACVVAERYFERCRGGVEVAGAADGGFGPGGEGGTGWEEIRAAVRAHAHEMVRFAALAAVVEGGSGDGEEWEVSASGEGGNVDYRIECMEVWQEVLIACAGASMTLGADLLPGAARVVNAMHGVDVLNSGAAVAALVRVAATEMRVADEEHRQGILALALSVLADAAASGVCMGPIHAIEVLHIVVYELPVAGREREDTAGAVGWLLGEVEGHLAGLSEAWLTRFLRAAAAVPAAVSSHEGVREELRACLQSKTFTPRNSYGFSDVVNTEFFADVRHELAPEREGFTAQWQTAHGRNASGFTPAEAAEAARCVKALRLFDGGSAVLEALLAVSMGGADKAAASSVAAAPRAAPAGGRQAEFQKLLQREIAGLGGVAISWIPEQPGDAALIPADSAAISETVGDCCGVYSALAAASIGGFEGAEGVGASVDGGLVYGFEGSYDGEHAVKVAAVMDETAAGVVEVMEALDSAGGEVDTAVELLREAMLREAGAGVAAGQEATAAAE